MLNTPLFVNRTDAGQQLAELISQTLEQQYNETGIQPNPIVFALPRGGLPVAVPIAKKLDCPLSIIVAKKISHPDNPELAIGAVTASGSIQWVGDRWWQFLSRQQWREMAVQKALNKARELEAQFLPLCPQVKPKGATIILVDDGIATGMTIVAAANALSILDPQQIYICAPVAPFSLIPWLYSACPEVRNRGIGYRVIVLATPEKFVSVSGFYAQFPQVNIEEALACLQFTSS